MKKIIYLLVSIIILSSCSGSLYSHYPKVKRQTPVATAKKEKHKKEYLIHAETLPAQTPPLQLSKGDEEIPFVAITPVAEPQKQTKHNGIKLKKKTIELISKVFKDKKQKSVTPSPIDKRPQRHEKAFLALILSSIGWGLILLGWLLQLPTIAIFVGVAALVLEILGLIFGINALNEINANPKAYTNRDDAMAAIIMSSVYLGLIVLGILLLIFIILIFAAAL